MGFYSKFSSTLNTLTFLTKTRLIVVILIGGMVSICFFTFISLFALKYDYESLFQERVKPIENVDKIRSLYLSDTFLLMQNLFNIKTSSNSTKSRFDLTNEKIDAIWNDYKNPKTSEQRLPSRFSNWWLKLFGLYDTAVFNNSVEKTNIEAIDTLTKSFRANMDNVLKQKVINRDDMDEVFVTLYRLNGLFANLNNYHIDVANFEKAKADKAFVRSTTALLLLILIVFSISSLITFFIVNHIRSLHNYLEVDVKKKTSELEELNVSLEKKTKELEELNNSLEKKIQIEVETSRKKDNILFQQSKLASLGEMLQNIAHQWRQPLGAIMMIIQSFEIKSRSGKLTPEFITSRVEDAQVLAKNMSETLDDFRTFFNPNKSKKEFSLKDVINKSIDLNRYPLEKEHIDLHVSRFKDVKFYGFKNELTHVLLNLINNAKDALLSRSENRKIWIMVKFDDENITIQILDNAGGVNPEIITRIFDPYFTTKHQSVGTGIGLYMCKQIIEEHMNGVIYCENVKHRLGTATMFNCAMFVIKIPLRAEHKNKETENE
ncbi:MAG: sensor histidine kinase [Campylobacteraceae bacterium]